MALALRRPSPPPFEQAARRYAAAWRWPAAATALFCLLTVPPIVIAALRTPEKTAFTGYVVIARDALVYQALLRAGWHGAWLFHPPYTSEHVRGILLYPWYLWPSHLVGFVPGPWLYHLSRLVAGAGLLLAIYLLTAELFRPRLLRRWAFILATLGGGVGALLPRDIRVGALTTHATEMASPGSSVADLISMAPHLPLAMALMCGTMVVGLRLRRSSSWRLLLGGLSAVIGLQLIYPQLALLSVLILATWSAIRHHRGSVWFSIVGALVQLPYLAYLLWVGLNSPAALRVVRTSLDVGDPFGFLVLSHLAATVLIVIALWTRRLRGDLLLPALWIAGMTIFMFAPGIGGTLGRSFMASSIPFGLCATPGLLAMLRRVRGLRWRRRVLALTLASSSFFGCFSLAQPYWIAAFRLDPHAEYENRDEAVLLARLAPRVSSADVVLTTYLDGLFIPAQTGARAYTGHPDMTIDAALKSSQALAFFTAWGPDERADFLRSNGIDYVLATDPGYVDRLLSDSNLRLSRREGGAAVFAVNR